MQYEEHGYKDYRKLYLLEPRQMLEEGPKELKSDNDVHILLAEIKSVPNIPTLSSWPPNKDNEIMDGVKEDSHVEIENESTHSMTVVKMKCVDLVHFKVKMMVYFWLMLTLNWRLMNLKT